MEFEAIEAAATYIKKRTERQHSVALVLGSGLGSYADQLPEPIAIPFEEIPGFPLPKVEGHGGQVVSTVIGGSGALVFSGRVHFYEGWPIDKVVLGVRTAVLAGCETVIITNASGGCGDGLEPGDLVLLRDHINLTGRSPLIGPNVDRLGPRFPDMSAVYPAHLRELAHEAAAAAGTHLKEGVSRMVHRSRIRDTGGSRDGETFRCRPGRDVNRPRSRGRNSYGRERGWESVWSQTWQPGFRTFP